MCKTYFYGSCIFKFSKTFKNFSGIRLGSRFSTGETNKTTRDDTKTAEGGKTFPGLGYHLTLAYLGKFAYTYCIYCI